MKIQDVSCGLPRLTVVLSVLVSLFLAGSAMAEPAGPAQFASPQQAATALIAAVKSDDEPELLHILGQEAEALIFSGDPVADRNGRARFLRAYETKNSLETLTDAHVVLSVGESAYPFPLPIVRQGGQWFFDTAAGKEEILNRRIGKNELHTIEVMQVYTDAQREFACMKHPGGSEFARKFVSSEGQQDGLYWEVAPGEGESPLGPLIARATREGYANGLDQEDPEPFHGYYFKILTAQGRHADGGAFAYVIEGKMVLGFALVAYPAKYGVSGIMTFMVNQAGVIYEKDLGEDTGKMAAAMTTFDPDASWRKYEESENP
ncbi:MAG: DUF2950 domain-containing protein [Desulfuromonadaceae bacterium]